MFEWKHPKHYAKLRKDFRGADVSFNLNKKRYNIEINDITNSDKDNV